MNAPPEAPGLPGAEIAVEISPLGAPVYRVAACGSTMSAARLLAASGAPSGAAIVADYQSAGRGRLPARVWESPPGLNLLCTIMLRHGGFAAIPPALTLQTGLCVARAVEELEPALEGRVLIKWPNDIMIGGRKAAGILCETDGAATFIGLGVNLAQREFGDGRRTGVLREAGKDAEGDRRFELLALVLEHIARDIRPGGPDLAALDARLFLRGAEVSFADGGADGGALTRGTLAGVDGDGALLIIPAGLSAPRRFVSGELLLPEPPHA